MVNTAKITYTPTVRRLFLPGSNVSLIATLDPTGNGTGVATLRLQVSDEQTVKLVGDAKFYTDAGGTLNESSEWVVTPGGLRTIYLKCPAQSRLIISNPSSVIGWGNATTDGWVSSTNAPRITIEVGKLSLLNLRISGNSILIGALPSGITGTLTLNGSNINWTYTGALPSGITGALNIFGSNINWTYAGALPSGITGALYLGGPNINWTYNKIEGTKNFTTFSLSNYRTNKMSSADMVVLLDSMRTKTGTFPATVTINDYADYASPPSEVVNAVNALKAAKSITTVNLGA